MKSTINTQKERRIDGIKDLQMIIRKATQKDKEDLARLYLQFWEAHPGKDPLITTKRKPTLRGELKAAEKDIRKKDVYLFVAVEKGRIIGFIELLIKKNDEIFRIKKYGYINSITIEKKYRKKGAAKLLVKKALGFFKNKGVRYARTNVYFSNKTAMKAWPRLGFRRESIFMIKRL